MTDFPKVLIIVKTLINDIDSGGASLRNWFKEWPREHLAQLYSGVATDRDPFCGFNFQIGSEERRFGWLFSNLKSSSFGDTAQPYRCQSEQKTVKNVRGLLKKTACTGGKVLIDSGLWELIFTPRLSSQLKSWIEEFRPDILFGQGCDISFMRLPLMIHGIYGIPTCFNIVDDWVEHLYKESVAAPLMQKVVQRTFRNLMNASACRFTIGSLMADEYQTRYGVPFAPLMQCDDTERFYAARSAQKDNRRTVEVVYSGSLALGRWKGLVDLAQAAERFRAKGIAINIIAYAPYVPPEASDALQTTPGLIVKSTVPDQEVPGILTAADLLFLPESFDKNIRAYIKLSVSTKAHLYMMSGKPSLVYGPPEIGTVDYARREGWGYVVDQEGAYYLAKALARLLADAKLRERLVKKGQDVVMRNHEGTTARECLRQSLLRTVLAYQGSP
jgi:glycosyltransferase involved in cell wall biosynthesis